MLHRDMGPSTIPLQPSPINVQVARVERGKEVETSIARSWRLGDARICRLCSRCTASIGDGGATALCLKIVKGYVADAEAPLFRDFPDPVDVVVAGDDRSGTVAG